MKKCRLYIAVGLFSMGLMTGANAQFILADYGEDWEANNLTANLFQNNTAVATADSYQFNFAASGTFAQLTGSIGPGGFGAASFDLTGITDISINGLVANGNSMPDFQILLFDSADQVVATADFLTASFTDSFTSVTSDSFTLGSGDLTDVKLIRFLGNGSFNTTFLNAEIDSITAVGVAVIPEPSTYALLALGAVALLIVRRKQKKAEAAKS
ncbi:MAG: PEP-CTERM sorting domain-containing protein [Verrucomicrobiota bacterium]